MRVPIRIGFADMRMRDTLVRSVRMNMAAAVTPESAFLRKAATAGSARALKRKGGSVPRVRSQMATARTLFRLVSQNHRCVATAGILLGSLLLSRLASCYSSSPEMDVGS